MHKMAADGPVRLGRLGLAGDEQGDPKNHGGAEMAVHHYPYDHYAAWGESQPALASIANAAAGRVGENISTTGLVEKDVCLGDVFRLGTAIVQVSQGRQPCWKLNVRFGLKTMAAQVQKSGRTGWYYRVVEEGMVASGDAFALLERPHADFPLTRLQLALYDKMLDTAELEAIIALEPLSLSWKTMLARRLETRTVEDWSGRLGQIDA